MPDQIYNSNAMKSILKGMALNFTVFINDNYIDIENIGSIKDDINLISKDWDNMLNGVIIDLSAENNQSALHNGR